MTKMTKRAIQLLTVAGIMASSLQAYAQFPNKPIELVVAYPPGASTDFIARTLQPPMTAFLGQSLVVNNKAGAGGNIGASYVARSPHTGYHLLLSTNATVTINPHVYRTPGFDTLNDFRAVALIANGPLCLTVNSQLGVNTLTELVAKAKEEEMSFGSAGNGSPQHVAGELLNEAAGIKMTHIPYRGIGPALNDLLGGTLPVMFSTCSAVITHHQRGAVKVLAVTTKERFSGLPQTPTVAETYANFDASAWFGIYAPKDTPDEVIDRLNAAVNHALSLDKVRTALVETALNPMGGSADELQAVTKGDLERWGPIVKTNSVQAN